MKTKSLPQIFLPFLALMTCFMPITTQAQQSLPYNATVSGGIPSGWIVTGDFGIQYDGYTFYAFSNPFIVLPELDAPTNSLTIDVTICPFYEVVYGADFQIGYLTDVNNHSTYHMLESFTYLLEMPWNEFRCKRADLSGVPSDARIVIAANSNWFIQSVSVYETPEPFDVPYSISTFSWGLGQPEGWIANNYLCRSDYNYFRSGIDLLPVFNSALNLLQLDISMKPYDSNAQSVEVGYVTASNSFTALQTFNYTSTWTDYQPKRISFSNAPSGARMAVQCNGNWQFNNVSVYNPSSVTYTLPYSCSFGASLPGGWMLNNYGYSDGSAYLTSGYAALPPFHFSSGQTVEFDMAFMPKNANANYIQIGYMTDPNDPSTFTHLEQFYNNSMWTEFQPKRTIYTNLPANARLAVRCIGDWNIRDASVRYQPTGHLAIPYHLSTFDINQPDRWIANSYASNGTFKTGTAILPRFNYYIYRLYLDLDMKPVGSGNHSISIGYATTSSSGSHTYTWIHTIIPTTDWTDYSVKRFNFKDAPIGTDIAISFYGEWSIRDVKAYLPASVEVPYHPTLGANQPDGWLANNYGYASGHAYLNNGIALLPQFNAEISTLLLDIAIMPKNTSATNIKFGYVTDPNDPSTFVATHTFVNSSWNDYLPKRMQFVSASTGARMAIQCNGDWNIAGVSVKATSSVQTVFDVPYNLTLDYNYPEGWIANNFAYSSSQACFTSGYAVLPQFNESLSALQLDFMLKPSNAAQTFQIGYVTNVYNPSGTFTAIQTFSNATFWNYFNQKRACFDIGSIPNNARMAIHCDGTWLVTEVSVTFKPEPFSVPYNETASVYVQPDGWLANNQYYSNLFHLTYSTGCAILPQFNIPVGTLQLAITFRKWESDAQSFSIGYVTNNNPSTFTALQTYSASSIGTNYTTRTLSFFGVPSDARMAFSCEGKWAVGGVEVTRPEQSLPYAQGFENTEVDYLPEGWYAPNMTVKGTINGVSPNIGSRQLVGKGYAMLPYFDAELNTTTIEFWCRPENITNGGIVRIGYIPSGGTQSSFVSVKDIQWNSNWTGYRMMRISYENVPTGARAAFYCMGYGSNGENLFHVDGVHVKHPPVLTLPYTEDFDGIVLDYLPQGWLADNIRTGYHPYGNDAPHSGVRQLYGTGVLVFPEILGGLEGVQADLWLRPSTSSNSLMLYVGYVTDPMDPTTFIARTSFSGGGWTTYLKKHVSFNSLNSTIPEGARLAIKAVATGTERWYIDDISLSDFDDTAPTLYLDNAGLHHADISWVPANDGQDQWDVYYMDYEITNTSYLNSLSIEELESYGTLVHLSNNQHNYTINNLTSGNNYYVWVRYRSMINGNTLETSLWSNSVEIELEQNCAPPTNLQVEVTQHTALVTWDPGQSNQTSWDTYGGTDDMDGETVYEPFRLLEGLEPGEEYSINVIGICEDGDGNSEGISTTFTTLPLPTLTVNDGHSQDNDIVPITPYSLPDSESNTQFIIPASQLIDMQYSDIRQISFYEGWYRNCAPWGADVWFKVRIMEVPEANYNNAQYPEDQFYGYNNNPDFETLYHGRLTLDNEGKMNISFGDHPFHYENGNLLIGVKQDTDDVGTDYQADWLGIQTQDWSSMYVPAGSDPATAKFLPKVTFTYEPDDYLPPTNFQANVTGAYEVTFSWTPRAGQTATEIMVCGSPDFVGNQFLTNSTDDHCTIVRPDFFEPEETYYYRYHGVYNVDGENHYSAWSAVGSFTMPDACEPPANLTVSNVGPFSAQLNWVSGGEYDEVQYSNYTDVGNVLLEEGFENCATNTIPEGWLTYDNAWRVPNNTTNGHNGGKYINANNTSNPTPKWLVLPQFDRDGYLSLWINMAGQSFGVYISTTGTDVEDFQLVQECQRIGSGYQNYIIPIMAQGFRHVAIMYQGVGIIRMDDVTYYQPVWTPAGIAEGGQYFFNDLTPGATYQARVSAMCETGYSSEWTTPVSFSTPGNIVFEDDNVKAICVASTTGWDTNSDGELSYGEAAAVEFLYQVFSNHDEITSFNELQYFTGLLRIDATAFENCTNLESVVLPTFAQCGGCGLPFISQAAFKGCTSLTSIFIPEGVNKIEAEAFSGCSALQQISLPGTLTEIGTEAFWNCTSLNSIYIPASVNALGLSLFSGSGLESIEVDPGNTVYDSRNGCNAIIETETNTLVVGCKNTVIPYGVTTIGSSAFENCTSITEITLPATVETLDEWAFMDCANLKTIEVNATTPPTMEGFTFGGLTWNEIKVFVPCGFYDVYVATDWNGFDLVENCNIVFEDLLTKELCVNAWDRNFDGELSYREAAAVTLLNGVFYSSNITRFNELQYFTGLDMIYEDDFVDCQQLVAVTLPPTVTTIDASSFSNCHSLTSLTLGENITDIGGYAFSGCEGLWFIKIEAQDPPTMGYNAFIDTDGDIPVYLPCGTMSDYEESNWGGYFSWFIDVCDTIQFADAAVRAICLEHWDSDHDGYLSYGEAAAVTSIGEFFRDHLDIQTFNELQYFTSLTEIGDNAFKGCAWLNTIELPATIASIGSLAFYNTGLIDMSLMPEAIRTIGFSAFGQCRNLTSIVIPASVNYIEGNPFGNCPALNNIWVYLSNPVYDSRNNCKAIIETATNTLVTGCKGTVIPDDVTALGSYAFSGQNAITSITIPSTVVEMGNGVFENCSGLTEIYIWAVTPPTMGYNVFGGVNTDDVWVYVPCGSLGYYDDDESWSVFNNIIGDCGIVFADANVKAICVANWDTNGDGELSFTEAAAVTTLNPSGENNSSVFKSNQTITSFDELQYFTGLTSIEAYAFSGCTNLTSITLPNTITSVATMAFSRCTSLIAITIPNGVTSIANQAFDHCSGLTSVFIPASVILMGNPNPTNPFYGCSALESITVDEGNTIYTDGNCNAIIKMSNHYLVSGCKNTVIPDHVVRICAGAFTECAGLTSIVIPNSVTMIGLSAFDGCTDLTAVTIGSSVETISARAFRNCTNLASITVLATTPPSLSGSNATVPFYNVPTSIPVYVPCHSVEDYQAATGWSNFTNIQARPDVICFEDDVVKAICVAHWDSDGDGEVSYAEVAFVSTLNNYFSSNTNITSFNELQYFVRLYDLNSSAFNGCSALESVTLPESMIHIYSYAFNGCTSLESITIPNTVTTISDRAFYGCTSLESITIPNAVTTIGNHAFYGCTGLTDITIGESVIYMYQYVFGACANLQSITVMTDTPPTLEYGVFYQVPTDIPVYVPCDSKAAYQAADGWSEFTHIIDPCAEVTQTVTLSAGTNWVSFNVEITLEDLQTALTDVLGTGSNVSITIQSQTQSCSLKRGRWTGSLGALDMAYMYKITVSAGCEIVLEGQPVNPANHPVTIVNGDNWIAFPFSESMTLTEAFAGFAVNNDIVTGQLGSSKYTRGNWRGGLTELEPGQGYIYNSSVQGERIFTFPTGAK